MYLLGIHTGHNATVGLLKVGKVIACASEERFNRKKNFLGFPEQALRWTLDFAKITMQDIDLVLIPGLDARSHDISLFNPHLFTQGNKIIAEKTLRNSLSAVLKRRFYKNPALWRRYQHMQQMKYSRNKKVRESQTHVEYARRLGVPVEKILLVEHHYCHAASTLFNLPRDRETLVLTLDGEGDGLCASVNVFDGKEIRRIASTSDNNSIGWLYMQATRALGMKPNEHEFKVMGLAPYAKDEYVKKVYDILRNVIWLDPKNKLVFKAKFPLQFSNFFFEEELKGTRFDNLAGGVQKLTEDLIVAWVDACIAQTGIPDVAIAGGVFMNVKASMCIAQMERVRSLFVMPSAGDESLVFGAMWHGYKLTCHQRSIPFNPQPLTDLYLGKEWSDEEIGAYLKGAGIASRYKVRYSKNIEDEIATLLAKGEVVARMNGRAEWGARALGNRSIMANPSNFDTVKLINEMIKNRDFWMPFTPSILESDAKRYFVNPKNIPATYMCITFPSTKLGQQHLPAAMHPYDQTIRPQVVLPTWNPSYHKIISAFKKRTGIGAVLNTSFNLHGEPNVNSPEDAIHTMDDSGLRTLALGNWLIQKAP